MPKPHFLMCRPDHFDVSYVINPWMAGNLGRPDRALARDEWEGFVAALREKAAVSLIAPRAGLPDMVFAANGAFVLNNIATVSNFRHRERQAEAPLYEEWLREHGFAIRRIPSHIAFEGAGDALHDRARQLIWAASGFRSDVESHAPLEEIYGARVASLHLMDERFYHLDTCLCPLDGGYVMYYPTAFDAQSVQTIEGLVDATRRIVVSAADAKRFTCNAVEANGDLFVNDCSTELETMISAAGLRVRRTPLSQFLLSGGANRCLTLPLDVKWGLGFGV